MSASTLILLLVTFFIQEAIERFLGEVAKLMPALSREKSNVIFPFAIVIFSNVRFLFLSSSIMLFFPYSLDTVLLRKGCSDLQVQGR